MKVRIMDSRIILGLLLGFFSTLSIAAGTTTTSSTTTPTWQLPAGYYTPAKMPMTLVFPRPDTETNSWARNRIAYADGVMQYRIPIAIQGGAYPYHFQLISGPTGMTIGQDYGNTDYGIVTWTPTAQGGPYNVDVKVTDQDGNSIDAIWTVTADNSKFIFIDPNSTTNGTNTTAGPAGSKVNPLNTLKGIAVTNSSGTTSPYAGKALILRAGTLALNGPETNGNYIMSPGTQNPAVFLGYTGETAEIDMSTGAFINYNQSDVYFGEVKLSNADPNGRGIGGETDTIMYFTPSAANRTTFFENTFYNLQKYSGTAAGSNQAAIGTFNPGTYRKYFAVIGNTIDNFSVALIDYFATQYSVIENNKFLSGSTSMEGIWVKSDIKNATVRGNQSLTHSYSNGLIMITLQDQGLGNDLIEVCYNDIIDAAATPTTNPGQRGLIYATEGSGTIPNPRIYVYRNTILGNVRGFDNNVYTAWLENNVFINSDGLNDITSGTYRTVYATDIKQNSPTGNLYGAPSDNYIDQNGNLIGTIASPYRGKVGVEIGAGYTPLSPPSWQ